MTEKEEKNQIIEANYAWNIHLTIYSKMAFLNRDWSKLLPWIFANCSPTSSAATTNKWETPWSLFGRRATVLINSIYFDINSKVYGHRKGNGTECDIPHYTHTVAFFNHGGELCIRSIQSIKIGIDLSIYKFDLIDINCIDQSVEIDDTLVSFID